PLPLTDQAGQGSITPLPHGCHANSDKEDGMRTHPEIEGVKCGNWPSQSDCQRPVGRSIPVASDLYRTCHPISRYHFCQLCSTALPSPFSISSKRKVLKTCTQCSEM